MIPLTFPLPFNSTTERMSCFFDETSPFLERIASWLRGLGLHVPVRLTRASRSLQKVKTRFVYARNQVRNVPSK